MTDSSGWAWIIPLHDGSTSVGVVMNQDLSEKLKAKAKEAGEDTSSLAHYMRGLDLAPGLRAILGDAELIKKDDGPILRSASDYSYRAPSYAGPGYRIVGDAGAFIDPYFSSVSLSHGEVSALVTYILIRASILHFPVVSLPLPPFVRYSLVRLPRLKQPSSSPPNSTPPSLGPSPRLIFSTLI